MPLFRDDEEILNECDQLVKDDELDAEDRTTIESFYNGRNTMSPDEAERNGITQITNHLFGYDSLNLARLQIEAIFTQPKEVWTFKFPEAPMEFRQQWEMYSTACFNKVIRESRRLKPHVKTLAGETTLHGSGFLMFRDTEDWCPVFARPLVPTGTGILASDVPYACIPGHLTLGEMKRYLKASEDLKKNGTEGFWRTGNLEKAIEVLEGNITGRTGTLGTTMNGVTIDEREQMYQEQGLNGPGYRMKLPVYYFYVARPEEEGTPFDLIILARFTPHQRKYATDRMKTVLPVCLFKREKMFERANNWLNPFFIDAAIGGNTSWHRTMGLGQLNYEPDMHTEQFFNVAMQGSIENLRRTFRIEGQADWELINRWNQGDTPSNVLPPGVKFEEAAKNPNFQYAFTTIQMLQQLSRRNASSSVGNSGDTSTNELEIQALERQGRNAEALAARMSDIQESADALGLEIFRRMCAPLPMRFDPGYEEIRAFQEGLRKDGVPIGLLRRWLKSPDRQVICEIDRSTGDGDRVRQIMVDNMLMSRLHLFNPQAQQIILRRVTANQTKDYGFAAQIVPYEPKPDGNQVDRANGENETCMLRGITGHVPERKEDDIDMVHIPEHLGGMQALLAKGDVKGWDQMDLAGFKAMGAHCAMHIQTLEAIPEQKQAAGEMYNQLQQLARQGQEFANNMKDSGKEIDPVEAKKLELAERKQLISERSQLALEQHRADAMTLSRQKESFKQVATAAQLANQENQSAEGRKMQVAQMLLDKQEKVKERANERSAAATKRAESKAKS